LGLHGNEQFAETDAFQEIGLGGETLKVHAFLLGGADESGEIDVGGQILITGIQQGSVVHGMFSVAAQGALQAVIAQEFCYGISVIYNQGVPALQGTRDFANPVIGCRR
jgi:hypothetical protein